MVTDWFCLYALQQNNALVMANSILKLKENGLITSPEEDPHIVEQLGEAGRTLRESEGEWDHNL